MAPRCFAPQGERTKEGEVWRSATAPEPCPLCGLVTPHNHTRPTTGQGNHTRPATGPAHSMNQPGMVSCPAKRPRSRGSPKVPRSITTMQRPYTHPSSSPFRLEVTAVPQRDAKLTPFQRLKNGRGAIDSKIHELCHLRHPRFDCSNGMSVSGEQSQMARSEPKLSNSCVLKSPTKVKRLPKASMRAIM